jgi:N-methylhydantoinase B
VERDLRHGRISAQEALEAYGVVISASGKVDASATRVRRAQLLRERLMRAKPALKPMLQDQRATEWPSGSGSPIYPGVEQRGNAAYAIASGAALALAPDHWTDGCPMLEDRRGRLLIRSYLDPLTGRCLLVEALPAGESRTVTTLPKRWLEASTNAGGA